MLFIFFFFQAEDGIRDDLVTGVQTCALPISLMLHTVSMVLEEDFGEIHTLEHPSLAAPLLESNEIKVILLDMNFAIGDSDGAEGLAWIKRIKEAHPDRKSVV